MDALSLPFKPLQIGSSGYKIGSSTPVFLCGSNVRRVVRTGERGEPIFYVACILIGLHMSEFFV